MFICIKNYITCAELWVYEVYEITAVEIKGRDPKIAWEIVGIYRVSNKNMLVLEKLADWTRYIWEELRSVASLKAISTDLRRIGMVTQKNLEETRYI